MTLQDYIVKKPVLLQAWDNGEKDAYPSLSAYVLADMAANGSPEERLWASTQGQRDLQTTVESDGTLNAVDNALRQGAERASAGGNTNQVQGSMQQGQFNTEGQTSQTGKTSQSTTGTSQAVQGQQTNQEQVGTTASTGATTNDVARNESSNTNQATTTNQAATTNQKTTGTTTENINQTTQGTNTRAVEDTLGFGQLLKSQAGTATANDATRNAVLNDVATTGGKQFGDQLQYGINRALSGPGMQGVGIGAQGRVAGSAAADIGRNNLTQRLQATEQLAGPTAVEALAASGNPYLGQTDTSKNTTTGQNVTNIDTNTAGTSNVTGSSNMTGTTNTAGTEKSAGTVNQTGSSTNSLAGTTLGTSSAKTTSDTIGLSDLLTKEANSGVSSAQGTQIATGQIPEGKTTSGGGCMVCSLYAGLGLMHPIAIRRGVNYKLDNLKKYRRNVYGYAFFGPLVFKFLHEHPRAAKSFRPVARAILAEECRLANPTRHPFRLGAYVSHKAFVWTSNAFSFIGQLVGHSGRIEDKFVETYLKNIKLWRNF